MENCDYSKEKRVIEYLSNITSDTTHILLHQILHQLLHQLQMWMRAARITLWKMRMKVQTNQL